MVTPYTAIAVFKRVLLFILLSCAIAKGQQFNFHKVDANLPPQCYCVLQDKKGFIWISSDKGLFKYDGQTVKKFDLHSGLPDPNVFQLTEDSHGGVLFGTWIGRVGYIRNDSIIFPTLNKKLKEYLKFGSGLIFDLYVDKNKILWISTYSGLFKTLKPDDYSDVEKVEEPTGEHCRFGITIIDNKKPVYAIYKGDEKSVGDKTIRKFFVRWPQSFKEYDYTLNNQEGNPTHFSKALLSNGDLAVSVLKDLYLIKPDGNYTIKSFDWEICSLTSDKDEGIWIGFQKNGLYYYNDAELKGAPVCSLGGCTVSTLIGDAEGGIWATTLNKGVFYAITKNVVDYSVTNNLNNAINGIGKINNKIVVNNADGALVELTDNSIRSIELPEKFSNVFAYFKDGKDVYIADENKIAKADTAFKICSRVGGDEHIKGSSQVRGFVKGADNIIYGVYYAGLYSINGYMVKHTDFFPARGRSIYITREGEMLVGTTVGLFKHLGQNKFLCIDNNINAQAIAEDNKGNIWVASFSGIDIVRNDKLCKRITEKDGLISNAVWDITIDKNEDVWAGTDNGISKITKNGEQYSITNYDERDGLIANQFYSLNTMGDWLWIGTQNGLCKMNIAKDTKNTIPPKVYIGSVYVNDSLITKRSLFSYRYDNFSFHIQGLTFKDNKARFKYRLLGLDTTWHASDNPDLQYSHLSSGSYTFEAKAINVYGIASVSPATFSFTIEKPFWKIWWFIVAEVLLIAGLIYLFIYYRLKTIRKKESEKTKLNKMLAEYQMSALRAQMNPHFIFNAINSIQEYVLENEPQLAYEYLTKFAQLVRAVLNNAKEKYINLEKELETLKIYVELEQLRFGNKFDFILDVDKNIDLYNIQLPAMIIQPYVENAIWHGLMPLGDARKGKLTISIRQSNNELSMSVQDNGVGRDKARQQKKVKQHKSVGMELTRQRIEMLNSLPEYSSSSFGIKDLYDESGNSIGTRVEIRILYKND